MTIGMLLIPIIVYILIVGFCLCLVFKFLRWLYTTAMTWTRVAFSLLVGLIFVQNVNPIVENSFLNFAIFTGISLIFIFLLSLMIRVDCAIKFGTAISVAFIVNALVLGIAFAILNRVLYGQDSMNGLPAIGNVILAIGCTIFAIITTLNEFSLYSTYLIEHMGENPKLEMVERILASLIYGIFFGIFAGLIGDGDAGYGELFFYGVPAAVATFVADLFLLKRWVIICCENS